MRWFRRHEETLNERLLREAGFAADGSELSMAPEEELEPAPASPAPGEPLGPDPRLPGVRSVERPAEWDVVTTADAPGLSADAYEFAALPDGSLLVDESVQDNLSDLADAVEDELRPPYRAAASRQSEALWSVCARRITVVELDGAGDRLELASVGGERTYRVDDRASDPDNAPEALRRLGEQAGADYAVEAARLDGNLWEATVSAL